MKNYFFFAICIFFTSALTAQEVSQSQYSLLVKKTADWCPRCGDFGWTFFKGVFDNYQDEQLIQLACHFDGGLFDESSAYITSNYGAGYQPVFWLNNEEIVVLSHTVNSSILKLKEDVNKFLSSAPQIGVGIDARYRENKIIIKAKAKALKKPVALDYYFGIYFVRNHLIANQSGQGNGADHLNVLSGKATSSPFGLSIQGGLSDQGKEFTYETTLSNITPHSRNLADMKIVGIVWSKDSEGKYKFVNGNIVNVIQGALSNNEDEIEDQFAFDVSAQRGIINIKFNTPQKENISTKVYDSNGRFISNQLQGINHQEYRIEMNNASSGIYFVQLRSGNKVKTEQVFLSN